jgi:methylglutaconyl-CoA hydratase
MTHPISDPLVEGVVMDDIASVVKLQSTPEGVAVVTIDRAAKRNALDLLVIKGLAEVFETLHGAEGVRVVFLRGAGGNFCAGVDPEWLASVNDMPEADSRSDAMAAGAMLKALADIPAVTVALVEGRAAGSGAGLAAACDMTIAVADAEFAFPEVKLGLIPAVSAPYVVDAIGPRAAKSLFVTGRTITAAEALNFGLVDEVVADAAGLDHAMDRIVDHVMTSAPRAVAGAKKMVWDVWGRPLDHHLMEDQAKRFAHRRVSEEGREGVAAFAERRKPKWAQRD